MDNVFYKKILVRENFEGAVSMVVATIDVYFDREFLRLHPKKAAEKFKLLEQKFKDLMTEGGYLQ